MRQTGKRIGSILLAVCMVLTLLPTVALAGTSADYTIDLGAIKTDATGTTDGYTVITDGAYPCISLNQADKSYRVHGSTTSYYLSIGASGISLTLAGASIATTAESAINLNMCDLNLILEDTNSLSGTARGIDGWIYEENLTIDGTGSVSTASPSGSAIAGVKDFTLNGGTVNGKVFASGTVTVNGGAINAAATGYANALQAGSVTINGGTLAVSATEGYGISADSAGSIAITGGSVNASGRYGSTSTQPTDGSAPLYKTVLAGLPVNTAIADFTAPFGYGTNDMKTDAQSMLYLWLPAGNQTVAFRAGATEVSKTFPIAENNDNLFAAVDINTDVSTAAALKEALQKQVPSTVTVTEDMIFDEAIAMGASHALVIQGGKTVTASNRINLGAHTLTMSGGGTFVSQRAGGSTLSGDYGILNLENIAVELKNGGGYDIKVKTVNVGDKATITLNSGNARDLISLPFGYTCTVNTGGAINIQNFWDDGIAIEGGTLHINGGSVTVGVGQAGNRGIYVGDYGTLQYTSGTLTGTNGSIIHLAKDAKVEGLNGKFTDQGAILAATGSIIVGATNDAPSSGGLTRGPYYWDGGRFAKEGIAITSQSQNTTVTQGAISGSLTVSAAASNGKAIRYQWWKAERQDRLGSSNLVAGATSPTFTIPTDLTAGAYYYYCVLSADGCENVDSAVAAVMVESGGGGGGGATPTTPTDTPSVGSTATTTVASTTDVDGKATASVPAAQIDSALKQAQEAAAKAGEAPKFAIKVEAPASAAAVETIVPKAAMEALAGGKLEALTISSPVASLSFAGAALNTIAGAATGDVSVFASKADKADLPAAVQMLPGDRPVYEFSVTSGGKIISQFGGDVTVAAPYKLRAGENPNAVIISYINASSNLEIITNGRYDEKAGTVVFTTDHFSKYAVGYHKIDFTDVADSAWYADAVTFLAARGVTSGIAAATFSPDGLLTRGQFITMLMRAYEIVPDTDLTGNFSDAGNTYYTGYLAAAKRLGISTGVGGNKFAPEQAITRQEIFTLLYNALGAIDKLPVGGSEKTLADYTDSSSVADWATEALTALVKSGTVSGSGGKLDPAGGSTRAQMAQVLYNLLGK